MQLIAKTERNASFRPLVVTDAASHVSVEQPYTRHRFFGDKSALWNEMRVAGASRRAIRNTRVIVRESESDDMSVTIRPRRRLFFHPIRFIDGKDAKKENQIVIDLEGAPKKAGEQEGEARSQAVEDMNRIVHDKLEDQVYYLAHTLHHRKLHNELAFPVTWGMFGIAANILLIQRFFPEVHTSLTLWFFDSLHKGFSLPGLIETLPGLGVGFAAGYGVSRLRNIPHVHKYKSQEKQFIADHHKDQLLKISLK